MQSPDKLRHRLNELTAPPGPEVDGLELALRSVVQLTAPTISGVIEVYTPEMLDDALERVALFFLSMRSDGTPVSPEFLDAAKAGVIDSTAVDELPAAPGSPSQPPGDPVISAGEGFVMSSPPEPDAAPPPPAAPADPAPASPPQPGQPDAAAAPPTPPAPAVEPAAAEQAKPPAPPWG